MKTHKWHVNLSNGVNLTGNGQLLGTGSNVNGDVTALTLNVRQGKTSLTVNLTLPGAVNVTGSGTEVIPAVKEVEQPVTQPVAVAA